MGREAIAGHALTSRERLRKILLGDAGAKSLLEILVRNPCAGQSVIRIQGNSIGVRTGGGDIGLQLILTFIRLS